MYAIRSYYVEAEDEYIKTYTTEGDYDSLYFYSDLDLNAILEQKEFELTGDAFVTISYNQKLLQQTLDKQYLKLQKTKVYWLEWVDKLITYKLYNEEIIRSALVLKLLSYDKSGAVLAARNNFV